MNLRTIPRYGVRSIPGDEQEIIAAFRRGDAVDGPAIAEFEHDFAAYQGARNAITASFGRMAFYYILRALELPPESEIIFPALTFWVVPEIARRAGLRPVFVDVDARTFNLDTTVLEAAITDRTRVIVPTHLYGQPCDMAEVMRIADKHDLIVVEDCAQAVGARYKGRLVGTFGRAAFFSFQMLKGINTYGGGMAVTDGDELAAKVRELSQSEPGQSSAELVKRFATGHIARSAVSPRGFTFWGFPIGAVASVFGHFDLSRFLWEKIRPLDPFPASYNRRFSNAQAILGLRGLKKLDENNARSRGHALRYSNALADCRQVKTPTILPDVEHVFYQYCLYADRPDQVARKAIRRGVDFETTHVDVCSDLGLFREFAADCPAARETELALQLPVYSRLRDSDVDRVLRVVHEVLSDLDTAPNAPTKAQIV